MLGLTLSSKVDWGSQIIFFAKLPPITLEPWFFLWSFFLLRLLCISKNLPYGHIWNIVVTSGLLFLVPTLNCWISYKNGYAGLLVLHLLLLLNNPHRWNVASLSLFIGITLTDVHLNWLNWFHSLILRSTHYSDRLHVFSVTIPRCWKDVYVNSFFLRAAML